MQERNRLPQALQEPTTLRAASEVALDASPAARAEIVVQVRRHLSGDPAVIQGELESPAKRAHGQSDPAIIERDSQIHQV
jgi:hypothetical protein